MAGFVSRVTLSFITIKVVHLYDMESQWTPVFTVIAGIGTTTDVTRLSFFIYTLTYHWAYLYSTDRCDPSEPNKLAIHIQCIRLSVIRPPNYN